MSSSRLGGLRKIENIGVDIVHTRNASRMLSMFSSSLVALVSKSGYRHKGHVVYRLANRHKHDV